MGKLSALAARAAARRLAGEGWTSLSTTERRERIQQARAQVTNEDRQKALRLVAKQMAQQKGLVWSTLPKDQRLQFIAEARRSP